MIIDVVAGTRPNLVKVAPLVRNLDCLNATIRFIYTGQHFDYSMSGSFFEDLNLRQPEFNLACSLGSNAVVISSVLKNYDELLAQQKSDLCMVVGDVNSTLGSALAAKCRGIDLAHVEAGLRSGDRSMPEEINRIMVDSVRDLLFVTSVSARENLLSEGRLGNQIYFVGNVMIDTLMMTTKRHRAPAWLPKSLDYESQNYLVLTLHRAYISADTNLLTAVIETVCKTASSEKVIFPCHPKNKAALANLESLLPNLVVVEPMRYLEFQYLIANATLVIGDSGGVSEETTFYGVPCITVRDTTERPETITCGTNVLSGYDLENLKRLISRLLNEKRDTAQDVIVPEKWDGKAAYRVSECISQIYGLGFE